MAYVEKVSIGGKKYYRLVHTLRKGSKIFHKRKYIGSVLPSKAKLSQLTKDLMIEITKGKYKYLSQNDVEELEKIKTTYNKGIRRLTLSEKEKYLKEFAIRFTYDSSKLSGVDITLRQTSLILKDGVIPTDVKTLKTVKVLENHERGVVVITQYKGKLNLTFIKKLHKILLSGIDNSIAGKTRDELKRNVKLAGTSYVPPSWQEINKKLNIFFKWYKSTQRKLHPLELAALVHLKIISMQPFVDGNSRLSRLLMNWILWKKNYPPIDIPIEDLENYYSVLDSYQIEHEDKPFVEYIKNRFFKSTVL